MMSDLETVIQFAFFGLTITLFCIIVRWRFYRGGRGRDGGGVEGATWAL